MLSGRLLSFLKKGKMVTRCHSLYHSLSLVVTCCHLLSFVVTRCTIRCHSLYHSLSLVVPSVVIRCHSLSLVVTRCTIRCHSLSLVITRCATPLSFYKRSFLTICRKIAEQLKQRFLFFKTSLRADISVTM